jgi:hypothetical protein
MKDNKIFSLGDRTMDGPIQEFSVKEGKIICTCGTVRMNGYDGVSKSSLVSLEYLV